MRKDKQNLFLMLLFLTILFAVSFLSLWHLQLMNHMEAWHIESTGGVFNTSPKTAGLISIYVLIGCLVIYNMFAIYLILSKK